MAAITIYAQDKQSTRIDELCPICYNPSLLRYTYERIDMTGITILGTRVACRDCRKWIGPTEECTE